MLLWKLIDGRLIHSENMTEEEAISAGYKPLVWTPQPEEGFYRDGWAESVDAIVRTWTEIAEPELDPQEALDILLGGDEQ